MCLQLAVFEREAKQPPEKIIPVLERAVRSKPDFVEAVVQLGLTRIAAGQFDAAIDTLTSISNVTPQNAPPLFSGLAYAYLQTGDLEQARKHAATARKWAQNAQETKGVDELTGLIEARSKGPFAPHPGEKVMRVEGLVKGVECAASGAILHMTVGERPMLFAMPDPKAVEFTSKTAGAALKLSCGPQEPVAVTLDYAPLRELQGLAAGVVRGIRY